MAGSKGVVRKKSPERGGSARHDLAWISKTLHDEVGQVLSAAGLRLELMRMDFAARLPEIGERTSAIQDELDRALTSVRRVVTHINPSPLKGSANRRTRSKAD